MSIYLYDNINWCLQDSKLEIFHTFYALSYLQVIVKTHNLFTQELIIYEQYLYFPPTNTYNKKLHCFCRSNVCLNRDSRILLFAFAFIPLSYFALVEACEGYLDTHR